MYPRKQSLRRVFLKRIISLSEGYMSLLLPLGESSLSLMVAAACPGTSQGDKDHFLAGALWGATALAFFR